MNGRKVSIYRDSMCTQTSVAADLVPEDCYTGRSVTMRGISGPVTLPLAVIDIQCELVSGKVQVAVVRVSTGRYCEAMTSTTPVARF